MKKLMIAFAALVVLIVIFGCADDIILPKDEPIQGKYYGTYTVTEEFGGPAETSYTNHVFWTFTETEYVMEVDTDSIQPGQECFCRVSGQYSLTDGVRLKKLKEQPTGGELDQCQACNYSYTPSGTFQRQVQGGTLILKSLDRATNIFHELELTRVADEPEEE